MKAQENTNKMMKTLFIALASLVLMNAACNPKGGGDHAQPPPPPPVYPNGCPTYPCGPMGGQPLYSGGTNTPYSPVQVTFQVSGDPSGNGMGSITGTVNFVGSGGMPGFVCQMGLPNLMGPYTMQMAQPGTLYAGMFSGPVMLMGPAGQIPASVQVVPPSSQFGTFKNYGLFTLYACGQQLDMNF